MNDNSTFPEPGSDLTVVILSTGPEEPGELLPWAADPNWQPPAEWCDSYQAIALEVLADKTLRSDRKRNDEMIRRGVPSTVDFVWLCHLARTNTERS